jgi:N-acetylmuramoyl-L-alanine amidase
MKDFVFILDRAHGENVTGKRSPVLPDDFPFLDQPEIIDNRFREYAWSDQIVAGVYQGLKARNIPVGLTVTGETEPGLSVRVRVANQIAKSYDDALLMSFHTNAANKDDKFHSADFVTIWTTRGKTRADAYATNYMEKYEEELPDCPVKGDYSDGDIDYESDFAVLLCKPPAILIEFRFQDNLDSVIWLCNPENKQKIIDLTIEFCEEIMNN